MFRELFLFELYYRRRRAATYVYFFLTLVISFLCITSPTLEVGAGRAGNASWTIMAVTLIMTLFTTIIVAAIMGVSIVRDFDHGISPLLFTTPVTKAQYLFGRFAGSICVTIFIHLAIPLGILLGYAIGPSLSVLGWEVAWRNRELMPFDLWTYIQPFLVLTVSNIFVTGSIFFCVGALVRKPIVIYSQSIILIMIWQIASLMFLRNPESQRVASLVDPFALYPVVYATRYWTPEQQNLLLLPLDDVILLNRLVWVGFAVLILIFTYWRFSFFSRKGLLRRKKAQAVPTESFPDFQIPVVTAASGAPARVKQIFQTSWFYFRSIWGEVPFLAIAGTGMLVLFVKAASMDDMYGTSSYPTTNAVLSMLTSFDVFFLILVTYYSGEMVWKERQQNIHHITDATPVATGLMLFSKFLSLAFVYFTFMAAFFVFGILLQAGKSYYQFDFQAYVGTLFFERLFTLCLLTVVAMLIQVLSNSKFMGFVFTIVFIFILRLLNAMGVEHDLVTFNSGSLGIFSEMNGFGHFITPFTWLKLYWVTVSFILFIPIVILYRRGTDSGFFLKWKSGKTRFTGGFRVAGIAAVVALVTLAAFIYYNSSILNRFESSATIKEKQVRYEQELKQYESLIQPKVVEVDLKVQIFPFERSFKATGFYYLKNRDSVTIKSIQVQKMNSPSLYLRDISFGRQANIVEEKAELGYSLYEISPPLQPGDSLKMDFAIDFIQKGFKGSGANTDLVYNGTFFRNNYFPTIGYDRNRELRGREERKKFALSARVAASDDHMSSFNSYGKQADRIRFRAELSTDSSQTAIAPGEMIKDWYEGNRHYHLYEAKGTIPDFYAIVSGRYEVLRDTWNNVNLEIYHDVAHQYNADRMMQGLKDGLNYYTQNFGSFPHSQLRIVEFPRYSTLAQSFPGMIAFSEGVGFILKISDPTKDLDVPYYVTAHELAHQWWGQQVMEADKAGRQMLSEGMAQYSALMVMNSTFPPEVMRLFLKYELDAYLKGRSNEKMSEVPLLDVSDQQYISFNKSALAFFAMQDYIGEDSLNGAFKRFFKKYALSGPPYPSSEDLISEIRRSTPDSLNYLLTDLFDNITLYENKAQEAAYRKLANDRYEITMTVSTEKLQVDNKGKEAPVAINDWIDVGIYGLDEKGKEKLIYLQKHKFSRVKNTLTIVTPSQPVKVGIDPLHKLIDHHSIDNIIPVGTVVELAASPLNY